MDFSAAFHLLSSNFGRMITILDHFPLIGNFSLLDFIVVSLIIDLVITGLFVTFNVNLNGGGADVEAAYRDNHLNINGRHRIKRN